MFEPTAGRLQLDINSLLVNIYIYIQTAMLGTREYTLCSHFRANAHNSSYFSVLEYIGKESTLTRIPLYGWLSKYIC